MGNLETASKAAAVVDAGADERSCGGGETSPEEATSGEVAPGELAAAPREPVSREPASREAASQAALDALLCDLLPRQGSWSDEGYLWLTDHGSRRAEFTDGRIEGLPMPTDAHQSVLLFLHALFRAWLLRAAAVRGRRAEDRGGT